MSGGPRGPLANLSHCYLVGASRWYKNSPSSHNNPKIDILPFDWSRCASFVCIGYKSSRETDLKIILSLERLSGVNIIYSICTNPICTILGYKHNGNFNEYETKVGFTHNSNFKCGLWTLWFTPILEAIVKHSYTQFKQDYAQLLPKTKHKTFSWLNSISSGSFSISLQLICLLQNKLIKF